MTTLLGKPVPHLEVSTGLPSPLRLYPGRPCFCRRIVPLGQQRAPPLRHQPPHSFFLASRSNAKHPGSSPNRPGRRIPCPSGPLRQVPAQVPSSPIPGLDQQATTHGSKYSVISQKMCLIVVDTHRHIKHLPFKFFLQLYHHCLQQLSDPETLTCPSVLLRSCAWKTPFPTT